MYNLLVLGTFVKLQWYQAKDTSYFIFNLPIYETHFNKECVCMLHTNLKCNYFPNGFLYYEREIKIDKITFEMGCVAYHNILYSSDENKVRSICSLSDTYQS